MNIHRYLVKNSKRMFVTDNTYQLQIFPLAQLKSKPFNVSVYNAKKSLKYFGNKNGYYIPMQFYFCGIFKNKFLTNFLAE